jgi:hypothetical protein
VLKAYFDKKERAAKGRPLLARTEHAPLVLPPASPLALLLKGDLLR